MEVIQGENGWPQKLKFVLEHNSTQLELKYAPQGWRELEIEWQRNLKDSAGIYRTLSVPLRFVKEGADFMRKALSNGLEENVFLKVYRHTYNASNWKYDLEFNCKASFVESVVTDMFFECPFVDEGLSNYLKKHSSAKYEIPIGRNYKIDVPDGVYLVGSAPAITNNLKKLDTTGFFFIQIPLNFIGDTYPLTFNNTDVTTDTKLFNGGSGGTMSIHGAIKFSTISRLYDYGNVDATVYLWTNKGFTDIGQTRFRYNDEVRTVVVNVSYEDFVFDASDYYLRLAFLNSAGIQQQMVEVAFLNAYTDGTPDLRFDYWTQTAPFSFYGMPLYNLFQKVIEKIYPNSFSITSKLLNEGIGKDVYVTSGDGIRGFDNAAIKLTLAELENSVKAVLAADFATYNNSYIIEDKSYFFANTEIANIGEVKEPEITVASDILANKIKVGYPDKEYDERNGRDEFNITLDFEVKINNNSETLEMMSVIRADSYGVQFTKINLDGKATTDSDSDNDPFFIHIKKVGSTTVVNKDIPIIDGSINKKGVFNVLLSPKRCLLRNAGWLASIFDKTNKNIEFISSERQDSNLKSGSGASIITEKDNVAISSLTGKLFIPYFVEFDAVTPVGIAGNNGPFANNNFGYISFSVNGYKLKGFPVSVMESMSEKKQQRCKVILHPDTPSDFLVQINKKTFISM
jgi:hypothetical protein